MLYYIINSYRKNIVQNIILIVSFFNLFLGLFFYANDKFYELKYNKNIFVSSPSDSKYVSYPFEGEMTSDDFVNIMDNSDLQTHVGYECLFLNYKDDPSMCYVYINDYMQQFQYPLQCGEWIENDESVVIGGKLASTYKIGDPYYIDSEYIGKIVGILGEDYSFMFLNVSGESLNFKDIFTSSTENIVITSNIKVRDLFDMPVSEGAILVDDYGYNILKSEGYNLKNYEVFSQMNKDEYETRVSHVNWMMMVVLIFAIVLNSFYLLYICVCKNAPQLRTMWEQGCSFIELSTYLVIPILINIVVSYIGVRLYSLKVFNKDIKNNNLYGILFLIVIFLFVCIFALTSKTIERKVKHK